MIDNLDLKQIVIIVGALYLVYNFYLKAKLEEAGGLRNYLINLLGGNTTSKLIVPSNYEEQIVKKVAAPVVLDTDPEAGPNVVDLVNDWRYLKNSAVKAGLDKDAIKQIDDIFPSLNKTKE